MEHFFLHKGIEERISGQDFILLKGQNKNQVFWHGKRLNDTWGKKVSGTGDMTQEVKIHAWHVWGTGFYPKIQCSVPPNSNIRDYLIRYGDGMWNWNEERREERIGKGRGGEGESGEGREEGRRGRRGLMGRKDRWWEKRIKGRIEGNNLCIVAPILKCVIFK